MSSEIRSIRQPLVPTPHSRPRRQAAPSPTDQFTPSTPGPERFPTRAEMQALVNGPNEAQEGQLLGGSNQPGRLVPLMQGRNGAVMTIHGVNAAPDAVSSLAEPGVRSGQEVYTFAYDDRFRRLTDSSQDLAGQLAQWMERNPGQPLTLRAHSMGGRVTLGALALLQEQGRLSGRNIQLDLVAPPLGGYGAANWARADFTGALGALIPVLRPGRDMGTGSAFQEQLENLRLPQNVRTRIFLGGRDQVVDSSLPGFQRIQRNLGAQLIRLPEADHNTILQQVR